MQPIKALPTRVYVWAAGVLVLLIVLTFYVSFFRPLTDTNETLYVYVDQDDDCDSVVQKVTHTLHTSVAGLGMLARYANYDTHMHTGRYAIQPGDNAFQLFRRLRSGQQAPLNLTIPQVRTLDRLAGALSRRMMTDSLTILQQLTDPKICKELGYDTTTVIALFIPNTYQIYWDVPFERFLQRMKKENQTFWNDQRLQAAQSQGLTPTEVITLASIVDEETANNTEKPDVAGMYLNRLHIGMPLQADPTIKFAWKRFDLKRIYHNLLDIDSPYNTYRYPGLPPGPIRIPSLSSIEAVLHAHHHDYLYMCAKEDFSGTHNFAVTYNEHLRNAARYSKALNEHHIQ